MARPIVLSNGELHVGLDEQGMVQEFYFPYVGLENHTAGNEVHHKVGIWVDGRFSWLDDGQWRHSLRYPHSALIGHTRAVHEELGIALEFDDFVDTSISAFMRNIHVVNLREQARDIRLFVSQVFEIGDSMAGSDTAQYLPDEEVILHYRGRRAFVISGQHEGHTFDQYTVGIFRSEGKEGTFRDAEDGELSFCGAEHGRVDSTIRFSLSLGAHSSQRVHYWIAAGTSTREALYVHSQIKSDGLLRRQQKSADWWHEWLAPAHEVTLRIAQPHRSAFIHSLMILRAHIDKHGALIASTDTTLHDKARDTYNYCWPRDAALAMWPLIRLGYTDEPRRLFEFMRRVMQPEGYLMHRYRPDGALGSSWHPYVHRDGQTTPPIQEDETALTLFMFAQFYQKTQDTRMLRDFYTTMVVPMASFLANYVDPSTGLPRPSYDLWEESYLTTTFTTGAVYGALIAASELAADAEDDDNAVAWRAAAEDMQLAAHKHLFNHTSNTFYRGILTQDGQIVTRDDTVETSSFFGAFMFGLFSIDSQEVTQAAATTKKTLGFSYEIPALARYENDRYHQTAPNTPNWWPIASLWMAQYELEVGNSEVAHRTLDWVRERMTATGVLPEQVHPLTQAPVSVAPLAWSHAEYLATLLDTITEVPDEE